MGSDKDSWEHFPVPTLGRGFLVEGGIRRGEARYGKLSLQEDKDGRVIPQTVEER